MIRESDPEMLVILITFLYLAACFAQATGADRNRSETWLAVEVHYASVHLGPCYAEYDPSGRRVRLYGVEWRK